MKVKHLTIAIVSAISLARIAHAGNVPTPSSPDEAAAAATSAVGQADSSQELESITVTARRRDELLQDVPIAVSAFSAGQLQTLNVNDIGNLQGQVPNLTVFAARGSNTTITTYIRGIGQSDPTWGADPGVGIYLNDVYIARPQGALLDVYDVQRIEVLRGPQGTLYGKNTIGGAIKYVSKDLPTQAEGYAEADVGNEGRKNIKLGLGTGSDDGVWRARVAYASLHNGGYGENLVNGDPVSNQNTNAGRASVGFFPKGVPFDAQLSVDAVRDNSGVRGAKMLAINKFDPLKRPPLDSNYDIRSDMPNTNYTHSNGAALNMNWYASSDWTLKSITAHRKSDTLTTIDFDTLPVPIANVTGTYADHQTSQEFQANYSGNGTVTGVVGFYYFDGAAGGAIYNNFLNLLFGSTGGTVYTRDYALYTDWTWQLAPAWSLSTGARFTDESKHAVVHNVSNKDGTFTTVTGVSADFDKTLDENNVSPRVSLQYKASDSSNYYASYSSGFKSGGYNIRANTAAVPASSHPFLPEKLQTVELGNKSEFNDGRFALNSALFYTRYRDIQLSVFTSYTLPNGTQGFFGDFTNAGRAHAEGAEFEFTWHPTEHWRLSGNLAALHTQYDEYESGGVNIAGQQKFVNAPNANAGLNVEYRTAVSFGGELRARMTYTYQTKVFPTTDLSRAIAQGPYGLLGAGVIWDKDSHWSFGLQGSNLTNKSYRTDGYNVPSLGILTGFYGAPRLIVASATYKL